MSPEVTEPTPPTVPTTAQGSIQADRPCVQCGYNLRGLQPTGACPECGTPVADSLRGKLLKYCSPDYLAQLHRGVFLIQTAIIIQILMMFALVGASLAFRSAAGTMQLVSSFVFLVVAAMELYGWWLFSELDPGYTGQDAGTTPRKVIRIAVIVSGAAAILSVLAGVLQPVAAGTGAFAGMGMLAITAWVVSTAANVAQYFASMLYIKWLAVRIPNEKARKRAKTLLWLGPILHTVGLILLGLGPLIALVLKWNLLDWVRKDLKQIRALKETAAAG